MASAARIFARHALETGLDRLPPGAVEAVKTFTLDSLGVAIAGSRAKHAEDVARVLASWGMADGAGSATLWAHGGTLPAPSAAFVNAFQLHCQEFDCVHEGAVLHPFTVVLPALFAEAERSGPYGGAAFIASAAVGVDLAVGLGLAATSPIRFFRPATAGLFGATLAVARLTGLSEDVTVTALGHALGQVAGTMQAHEEGKPVLPLQIGGAARAALCAIDWARAGIPAPEQSIEGPFGYLPLLEDRFDLDAVLADLGKVWRVEQVSHKPYPTGRAAHGGIRAVQHLMRDHGVSAHALDRLTLTVPPLIHTLVGRPIQDDLHVNYARLCFPYVAAIVLTQGGTIGLEHFTPDLLSDPEVIALGRRIHVVADSNPDPAAFVPQTAVARLKDGSEHKLTVDGLPGAPQDRLSREEHLAKFRSCVRFGLGAAGDACAEALIAAIDRLDTQSHIGRLAGLTVPSPDTQQATLS